MSFFAEYGVCNFAVFGLLDAQLTISTCVGLVCKVLGTVGSSPAKLEEWKATMGQQWATNSPT